MDNGYSGLDGVESFDSALPKSEFAELRRAVPESHFDSLLSEGFRFYRTTFWYPLDRTPENVFESVVTSLKALANPSPDVVGVEWWFSVLRTNASPQWLLSPHFDRNDLAEHDTTKLRHPDRASVLFLNAVPYGDLVVTDQVLTEKGPRPKQPGDMVFIRPSRNRYACFPGHLYHGVIGRMWRSKKPSKLRISMAVNYWAEPPNTAYLADSRHSLAVLGLAD